MLSRSLDYLGVAEHMVLLDTAPFHLWWYDTRLVSIRFKALQHQQSGIVRCRLPAVNAQTGGETCEISA